jgi:Icc-related predicted phosphoesterase
MNILVLADDDGTRHQLTDQPVDLVLSLGDLSDAVILQAARQARCSLIFAVKGNHDSAGPFPSPIVDLHLAVQTLDGIRFGGFNGSWRYKPRGHFLYEQEEVEGLLSGFPTVDVFVAHNSPRNMHELDTEFHIGFEAFNHYIKRVKPRLFLHGHQHANRDTLIGLTHIVGIVGQRRIEIRTPALGASVQAQP